jgi:hypothetical protein
MNEITKSRQKKAIRYDYIDLLQYDIKTTILGKISFQFPFREHFYVKIADANGHNLRYCFRIILYTKYQFHLIFHTESQFTSCNLDFAPV